MFWTYCTLELRGRQGPLDAFTRDHGLPGSPLRFGVLAGVPALSDPEAIMAAWGASGPPEPQGSAFYASPGRVHLHFRCPTAPPIPWFRRLARVYPGIVPTLTYATEATGVNGRASSVKGVFRITESEGNHPGVQSVIERVMKPSC